RAGPGAAAGEGQARRAVAARRGRVHAAADAVGDGDGDALRLAGRVGQAVDDGVARVGQDRGRLRDGLVQRRGLAADQGDGPVLDVVVEEPRLAEDAGVL